MFTIEISEHQNNSLNQIIIKNEVLNFNATIYPNLGASLQQLQLKNIDIIDGITSDEKGLNTYANRYNSSLLFPFPNRISDGKYDFKNGQFQLNCNDVGFNNALHGLVFDKPFEIKKVTAEKDFALVELSFTYDGCNDGFPFPFNLSVSYLFNQNSMEIGFNVKNKGESEFPYGLGWHPYFKTENIFDSVLDFEGANQFTMNAKMIPENTEDIRIKLPLAIENNELDDCYTLNRTTCNISTPKFEMKMNYSSDENFQFLQVYTPPNRKSIAIEPMTCIGNSFNNKIGMKVLKPEDDYKWKVYLEFKLKA